MLPLKNSEITQPYGRKNPAYSKGYHTGVDYAARSQDKSVYAVTAGTVIRARFAAGAKGADPSGWGNYVIVRTADGHDLIYAHLASVAVTQGMTVTAGERLGIQGSTGNSTGPHLHFEVRRGDWTLKQDVDPVAYLDSLKQDTGIPIRLFCTCGDLLDVIHGDMIDGTVNGPVRALMEAYGHTVVWDGTKVDIRRC
jgi:murein DD-endopeptidase MepM/ murein hydrolase activator NlpD